MLEKFPRGGTPAELIPGTGTDGIALGAAAAPPEMRQHVLETGQNPAAATSTFPGSSAASSAPANTASSPPRPKLTSTTLNVARAFFKLRLGRESKQIRVEHETSN